MKTKEENKKFSYIELESEHFKKVAEKSKRLVKERKQIEEDRKTLRLPEVWESSEDLDPIKEIYKEPIKEKSKDLIDFIIEERIKKDIPYKNDKAMETWNKRGVLNRMIQIVINTDQFKHHISEEFYYLYHCLSTDDKRLFELWLNNYNCGLNRI